MSARIPDGSRTQRVSDESRYIRIPWINDTWTYEHIAIAELAFGRPLSRKHQIYHVNGIKNDNRNQNLVICEDRKYHALIHRRTNIFNAGGDPNTDDYCKACDKVRKRGEPCMSCYWRTQRDEEDLIHEYATHLPRAQQRFIWAYLEHQPFSLRSIDEVKACLKEYVKELRSANEREAIAFFMSENSTCLLPNCNRDVVRRGICGVHYDFAVRLVGKELTTWAELEAKGKVMVVNRYKDLEALAYFTEGVEDARKA